MEGGEWFESQSQLTRVLSLTLSQNKTSIVHRSTSSSPHSDSIDSVFDTSTYLLKPFLPRSGHLHPRHAPIGIQVSNTVHRSSNLLLKHTQTGHSELCSGSISTPSRRRRHASELRTVTILLDISRSST